MRSKLIDDILPFCLVNVSLGVYGSEVCLNVSLGVCGSEMCLNVSLGVCGSGVFECEPGSVWE